MTWFLYQNNRLWNSQQYDGFLRKKSAEKCDVLNLMYPKKSILRIEFLEYFAIQNLPR
jgi:hypothetical protein